MKSLAAHLEHLRSEGRALVGAGLALSGLLDIEETWLNREDEASNLQAPCRAIVEQLQRLRELEALLSHGHSRTNLVLRVGEVVITALFSFMTGWSEFMVARVMLTSQELMTLPLGLESLFTTYQTEWANYAAGSLLVCIPVVVLFLVLNRFLVSGLTLGGVKG